MLPFDVELFVTLPGLDANSVTDTNSSPLRATSPATTGIPTPSGRSLPPRSQSATPDKSQNRNIQSSTPTPGGHGQRSNIPNSKQNSMLEKFKLFKDKDKSKTKGSAGKSSSKTGSGSTSTSTLSTSSRSDTSSSISARSSSSAGDAGPSSSATSTNDPDSPKLSKARPIVGGTIPGKRENLGSLTIGHQQSRQTSPSPYSSSLPATPVSSLPVSHSKKSGGKSSRDGQSRMQLQSGSQTLTKSSKGGSLIPKSGSKAQKSSSTLSLTSSSSGSQIPTFGNSLPGGSSIPTSGNSTPNTSIPKPSQSSSKISRSNKEEKMRGTGYASPQTQNQQTTSLPKKSRSHGSSQQQQQQQQQMLQLQQQQQQQQQLQNHLQQQQLQQQKMNSHNASQGQSTHNSQSSSAPPVPPHRNGNQTPTSNQPSIAQQTNQKVSSSSSSQQQQQQQQKSPQDGSTSQKTRYTEIEYTDGKIERVGEGHFAKPTNQAVVSNQSGNRDFSHPYLITSQSVNVVKPTCSSPHAKSDGNTQTTLSIVHNRSAQPPPLPKTDPPPSTRTTVNNQPQTSTAQSHTSNKVTSQVSSGSNQPQSPGKKDYLTPKSQDSPDTPHSTSSSSNDSVILNSSAANSPRLGIKLGSQTNRPANNVAIVQPHHGEKKETTFDKEIRTDVISKGDKPSDITKESDKDKDKTLPEKKTTFIADSGETLDIKPMEPINRNMHYAPGYMGRYASPGKPMPISMSQNQCYAMTGISPNRMGVSRSLLEANKFYSGSMKRATSSGSGNVSYDDYSSDYDTYDYISGYMSDGDILKGNKMDDMSSGYMSEGGASLYARRLQQRFREGMQAVKECMQKSNNVGDEDR